MSATPPRHLRIAVAVLVCALRVLAASACATDSVLAEPRTAGPAAAKPASPPPDSPAFAAYRRLCLDTRADPAAALAAAKAQGWSPAAPDDRLPLGALSARDVAQRSAMRDGRSLHLVVAHADDPASLGLTAQPWRVCIVSASPADPGAAASLAAMAGVAPAPGSSDAGSALYVIADPDGPERRSAAGLSDAALQPLVASGRLLALGVQTAGATSVLLAARPGR